MHRPTFAISRCLHTPLKPWMTHRNTPSSSRPTWKKATGIYATNGKNLGIRDSSIAAAVAAICRRVNTHADGGKILVNEPDLVFDELAVNGPLVAAAIRLAKAMDPKSIATAAQVHALLPPAASRSYGDYDGAFKVKRLGPHPYLSGTIQMQIKCKDPEIHRALKHHERLIQQLLHRLNRQTSPCFLFTDVLYEIEAEGYTPVDLKFSVDTSAALQLLTGNRLYTDNRVFLRELIQNAVDACHLRQRLQENFEPSIAIRFNDDISIVTIRDNGIGMDRQWIEKYFLTIGISLYQSSEVHSAGQRSRIDFSFISQFGIGFLSSFLVAAKIVIKTRKADQSGLKITITSLKDYFDVRPLDEAFDPGTEVRIHLKKSKINYSRSLEYLGYLKTNIRFLEVPVTLHKHDGQTIRIGREKLLYADPNTADIDFIAPLEFKSSEGCVLLRAKKNVDRILSVEAAKGGIAVFQDGIFVTQDDALLPEGARRHVVGRINLQGEDKCALSMDRNRIFWTETQMRHIKKAVRLALAQTTKAFLVAVEAQATAPQTRQSIINQLAIFFDFNEVDDAIYAQLGDPIRRIVEKRFRNFVRIHFAHTLRSNGIPEADGYSHRWQQSIIASFRN